MEIFTLYHFTSNFASTPFRLRCHLLVLASSNYYNYQEASLLSWVLCRNAYNDLYHWTARYSFLEKLISEGREMYNVVYIDPDILIIQDLHSLFERDFDYLMTISENEEQPINGAMHFVPKGKYHQASPSKLSRMNEEATFPVQAYSTFRGSNTYSSKFILS